MFPIRAAEPLSPAITRFRVAAPLVARKWQAGQFAIVRVTEGGERIPLTVVEAFDDGSVTLIVQAVGKTTRQLCALRAGDALLDVLGPLGNPTPIERHGRVACVGGGVGAAELLPIARALQAAGNELHAIVGARHGELLILEREIATCAASLALTTDDGSRGRRGVVTGPLLDLLGAEPGLDAVYAIGPLPMMRSVAEATRTFGVKTYVSLNAIMLDGTGMCGGCRVTVGGEMRFACVDGPEFDGHAVDFDELIRRNRTYAVQERLADERWRGRCASGA
jgi:ferredoxin/flavodoxin---NADP+ reductase